MSGLRVGNTSERAMDGTMEEKLGTRFGNYELVRRIDVGGMGEVYLAHQLTAFGRVVAIKIIRSDLVHDMTARARFLREAEVSAHLKHEHILSLFDFGEVDGRLFLVTPYIEGGTLATRLQQSGPLSLAEARQLFVPLVQAVAYIHRRGVVHRDLKPTNIMLDMEDGEIYVRLIDFGIASLQGQNASPPLTTAGHEMGTVAYMAPERLSGIAAPSNDIFSLGVILHQMLTARMPTAAPPSKSAAPRLPEPLAQVVRGAVAANPAERYATADELLRGFEQAYQQVMQARSPEISVPTPTTNRPLQDRHVPSSSRPELVSLAHSGEMPALSPTPARTPVFTHEDYNAPTTSFQPFQPYTAPPTNRPPLIRPRPPRPQGGNKRHSFFLVLAGTMVLLLVIIASMLYYGFQVVNAASVSVSFAPQTRVISQVLTLKADPAAQTANTTTGTVRAYSFTLSKTATQTGNTTGQVNCFFFGCQQGVDGTDVINLTNQMLPALQQSISQDLQNKVSAAHGTEIAWVNFSEPVPSSTPQVGNPGRHVSVSVTEQGSVGYFLNTDEATIVNQSLATAAAQLGQGYQLITSTVNSGHPATRSINPNSGVSSIAIPVGAVARYQFTPAQLQSISSGLVGKSLTAARAVLQSQPGIDPASITIHFTAGSGSTMPGDTQHIKLTQLNSGTLPSIQLTPVSSITPTPTNAPTSPNNGD